MEGEWVGLRKLLMQMTLFNSVLFSSFMNQETVNPSSHDLSWFESNCPHMLF